MEIKINQEESEFKPIEITITLQSEEDLCSLWHRFNVSKKTVNKESEDSIKYECAENYKIWKVLDILVDKNNLNK
tara:strand:- start:26380 stop:26604 length:225 start_codon:yes stop_codon:yes gene_type:complete